MRFLRNFWRKGPSGVPNGVYSNNVYIDTHTAYNLQKIDSKLNWNTTSKLRITAASATIHTAESQAPAVGNVLGGGGIRRQSERQYLRVLRAQERTLRTPSW